MKHPKIIRLHPVSPLELSEAYDILHEKIPRIDGWKKFSTTDLLSIEEPKRSKLIQMMRNAIARTKFQSPAKPGDTRTVWIKHSVLLARYRKLANQLIPEAVDHLFGGKKCKKRLSIQDSLRALTQQNANR
jgi:hypothetical protein